MSFPPMQIMAYPPMTGIRRFYLNQWTNFASAGKCWDDLTFDIYKDEEEGIPLGQPMIHPSALKVQVDKCLSRKAYLRVKNKSPRDLSKTGAGTKRYSAREEIQSSLSAQCKT